MPRVLRPPSSYAWCTRAGLQKAKDKHVGDKLEKLKLDEMQKYCEVFRKYGLVAGDLIDRSGVSCPFCLCICCAGRSTQATVISHDIFGPFTRAQDRPCLQSVDTADCSRHSLPVVDAQASDGCIAGCFKIMPCAVPRSPLCGGVRVFVG